MGLFNQSSYTARPAVLERELTSDPATSLKE